MRLPGVPAVAPSMRRLVHIAYPGRLDQIRRVREDLRLILVGCPIADDIILCTSELAANAALHSRSRLGGATFTVRAEIFLGSRVRVEVHDLGGPWRPARGLAAHHGLDIVCGLATAWGIEGDDLGRIAWVSIDWPPAATTEAR